MNQDPLPPRADGEELLDRLLSLMHEGGGFPALAQSVGRIVEALEACAVDTSELTEYVLSDLSLTQKVLRLANSPMYATIGRDVSTVSDAMKVLGYEAIGHLALGVKLIDSLVEEAPNRPDAKQALGQSLIAGSIASAVNEQVNIENGEEAVVCALLYRLGHLMTVFYLQQEWGRIQAAVRAGEDEATAATEVLGMTFEELGSRVAQRWNFPVRILRTMTAPDEAEVGRRSPSAYLRAMTHFANLAAVAMTSSQGLAEQSRLSSLAGKYGTWLGVDKVGLLEAVRAATDSVTAEPLLAQVLRGDFVAAIELAADSAEKQAQEEEQSEQNSLQLLRRGLDEIRRAISEKKPTEDVLHIIVDTIYDAMHMQRVAIFMLDAHTDEYSVLVARCHGGQEGLMSLSFPAAFSHDLPHLVLAKNVDVYIDNPLDTRIAHRLPMWIVSHGAHPFFLYPLSSGGKMIGLLFGQQRGNHKLPQEVLTRMKALRDLLQVYLSRRKGI